MRMLLVALAALSLGAAPLAQKKVEFKMATLVPEGSIWDKQERLFGEDARKATDGRMRFKFYAGGIAGDEPDVLRKMRLGQLHGGVFTMTGLGDVLPDLRVLDIPLFLHSEEEAYHLLKALEPYFRTELEKKGVILLHWGHVGWLRFFSTEPVRTVGDLKSLKQFVWAGMGNMARWYQEAGFQPVPLAATDMLTGLKTGLIEALPSAPLAALSLQWFRSAPYMLDYPVAPMLGAVVVDARRWKKLSAADQAEVLAAAGRIEERIFDEIPKQEAEAIAEMAKRGMTVTKVAPGTEDQWFELADFFAERMQGNMISPDVLSRAKRILTDYRAQQQNE